MIKPDSQKFRFLELIGICGEFPACQTGRLFSSPSYAEKVITELKAEKLIRSEPFRRIRLHQKSQTYLTLSHASIPFYTDEKPDIFSCKDAPLP